MIPEDYPLQMTTGLDLRKQSLESNSITHGLMELLNSIENEFASHTSIVKVGSEKVMDLNQNFEVSVSFPPILFYKPLLFL